jgi:DNA-directed RNA polymerase subunit RPC12/RpoP
MIRYSCPTCKSILESPDHKAGEQVTCPQCQQRMKIPGARSAGQSSSNGSIKVTPFDLDLARLVTAWRDLPDPIRKAILALVDTTGM